MDLLKEQEGHKNETHWKYIDRMIMDFEKWPRDLSKIKMNNRKQLWKLYDRPKPIPELQAEDIKNIFEEFKRNTSNTALLQEYKLPIEQFHYAFLDFFGKGTPAAVQGESNWRDIKVYTYNMPCVYYEWHVIDFLATF